MRIVNLALAAALVSSPAWTQIIYRPGGAPLDGASAPATIVDAECGPFAAAADDVFDVVNGDVGLAPEAMDDFVRAYAMVSQVTWLARDLGALYGLSEGPPTGQDGGGEILFAAALAYCRANPGAQVADALAAGLGGSPGAGGGPLADAYGDLGGFPPGPVIRSYEGP